MDKIKLFDGTILAIEDYAAISRIVHNAKSAAKAQAAAEKFTSQNLAHVEFFHGDEINGVYENLALTPVEEGMENPVVDGKKVTVSLYQM